jgi:hypothetical protein
VQFGECEEVIEKRQPDFYAEWVGHLPANFATTRKSSTPRFSVFGSESIAEVFNTLPEIEEDELNVHIVLKH